MLATININNSIVTVDFLKPLDISIVMSDSAQNPLAWYIEKPVISPVQLGDCWKILADVNLCGEKS